MRHLFQRAAPVGDAVISTVLKFEISDFTQNLRFRISDFLVGDLRCGVREAASG